MSTRPWKNRWQQAMALVRKLARQTVTPPQELGRAPRIGLALSGGFARGIAHIGVLKVLEENGIPLHCLAGTSIGSIIASAYASGASIEEMTNVARRTRWNHFARWTVSRMGLASNHRMDAFLKRVFRATRFEDLKIPVAIAASDLTRVKPVLFTSGDLVTAIRASCAYPGLFLPVEWNGSWLVDGMLVAPVPVEAARQLGADIVVAVHLYNLEPGLAPQNLMEILGRSFALAQRTAEPLWRAEADLVVEPRVHAYRWDNFEHADELIAAGEKAMREALPRLQALLGPQPASQTQPATV